MAKAGRARYKMAIDSKGSEDEADGRGMKRVEVVRAVMMKPGTAPRQCRLGRLWEIVRGDGSSAFCSELFIECTWCTSPSVRVVACFLTL